MSPTGPGQRPELAQDGTGVREVLDESVREDDVEPSAGERRTEEVGAPDIGGRAVVRQVPDGHAATHRRIVDPEAPVAAVGEVGEPGARGAADLEHVGRCARKLRTEHTIDRTPGHPPGVVGARQPELPQVPVPVLRGRKATCPPARYERSCRRQATLATHRILPRESGSRAPWPRLAADQRDL